MNAFDEEKSGLIITLSAREVGLHSVLLQCLDPQKGVLGIIVPGLKNSSHPWKNIQMPGSLFKAKLSWEGKKEWRLHQVSDIQTLGLNLDKKWNFSSLLVNLIPFLGHGEGRPDLFRLLLQAIDHWNPQNFMAIELYCIFWSIALDGVWNRDRKCSNCGTNKDISGRHGLLQFWTCSNCLGEDLSKESKIWDLIRQLPLEEFIQLSVQSPEIKRVRDELLKYIEQL